MIRDRSRLGDAPIQSTVGTAKSHDAVGRPVGAPAHDDIRGGAELQVRPARQPHRTRGRWRGRAIGRDEHQGIDARIKAAGGGGNPTAHARGKVAGRTVPRQRAGTGAGGIADVHQQIAFGRVVGERRLQRDDDVEVLRPAFRPGEAARNFQFPAEDLGLVGPNVVGESRAQPIRIARRGREMDLKVGHDGVESEAIRRVRPVAQLRNHQRSRREVLRAVNFLQAIARRAQGAGSVGRIVLRQRGRHDEAGGRGQRWRRIGDGHQFQREAQVRTARRELMHFHRDHVIPRHQQRVINGKREEHSLLRPGSARCVGGRQIRHSAGRHPAAHHLHAIKIDHRAIIAQQPDLDIGQRTEAGQIESVPEVSRDGLVVRVGTERHHRRLGPELRAASIAIAQFRRPAGPPRISKARLPPGRALIQTVIEVTPDRIGGNDRDRPLRQTGGQQPAGEGRPNRPDEGS